MPLLRDKPIKQKLVIIIMLSATAALLAAGFGFVLADTLLFRANMRRDLAALSRIIADNSTAALAFDDPKSAAETLAALRTKNHVVGACIYAANGSSILATYARDRVFDCPPAAKQNEVRQDPRGLIVSQKIVLTARQVGTLVLLYDLHEIWERIVLYGGTVLVVLLPSLLLAFWLSSRLGDVIAAPISLLVRATTIVAETGDYTIRAPKLSSDELGLLVDRFNAMLAGIHSRELALKAERERFEFMAESMPQKIFTVKPGGDVDYFNCQWTEFTGLTPEQIRQIGWSQFVHADDLEESLRLWQRSLASGDFFQIIHRFRSKEGSYHWHLSRAHAMRDAEGNISMWIGSATDIHEQRNTQEQLARANEDLTQFAFAASHDLQEPLRMITSYSQMLVQGYRGQLDERAALSIGYIEDGTRRMRDLLADLLAYTSIAATAHEETEAVDLNEVVGEVIRSLRAAIEESAAIVTSDGLPSVDGQRAHFVQLFRNLIGNALKYRSHSAPRIRVSFEERQAEWRMAVSDNGIGIAPQHHQKIFGVFKRLHGKTIPGTGIGLAICQRVVERYRGRIWVESELDRGATFWITLPIKITAKTESS